MTVEQEIKMVVPKGVELDLTQQAWLDEYIIEGPETKHLLSTYFDTPKMDLQEFGVGLRLRQINDQWLQTVKCSGHAVAGLHQRKEWEHELTGPQFDEAQLKQTDLAPLLAEPNVWPQIIDIFTTDFIRQQYILKLDEATLVELAYDKGQVISGAKRAQIHEVELELKQGSLEKMISFAEKLKTALGLEYSDISKAAQGYGLFLTC